MTDAESQMAAIIASVEASNEMADQLDRLKVNLESRGWSSAASETASITITNSLLHLTLAGHR